MKKIFVNALLIALVIAAIFGSFFLGQSKGVRKTIDWYNSNVDTVTTVQTDTNSQERPIPDTVYMDKIKYYPVYIDSEIKEPQIIYRDSMIYVPMERTIKEYKTENYLARISGVDPNLDFIETYNKTVTNTVYVPQAVKAKPNYFSLDGQFIYDTKPMIPVTANMGYRKGLFDVSAGAGYDFLQNSPVFKMQMKVGFSF